MLKRVLLDECLPRHLKRSLAGHEVRTVPEVGWASKDDGELLTLLVRVPHLYNYPWPITPQNAARQYLAARRLILALRVLVVLVFLELLAGTTSVALGRSLSLGPWSMPALLSCLGLTLISYVAAARRAR